MSERKVDPVAVLESLAGGIREYVEALASGQAPEAIAAVRELVEAARDVSEQFAALVRLHGEHTCWDMRDRLIEALSKFPTADSEVGNGR